MPQMSSIDPGDSRTVPFQPNQRQLGDFEHWRCLNPREKTETMFRWVLAGGKYQVQLATAMFLDIGAPAVPWLVEAAVEPRRSSTQRIRLLDMIEAIGVPLETDEFLELVGLRQRSKAVHRKILGLLYALGPGSGENKSLIKSVMPPLSAG